MESRIISAAFFLLVMTAISAAPRVSQADDAAAWDALRSGDAILMMRHALAPGTDDPANFELGDCSTQRNLNDAGREQAKSWKPFLAEHGITAVRIFSSQWCRCMDTATGMDMGKVTEWPSLNSFFRNRSDGPRQTRQTIARANALESGEPVILVSHQVNVTMLAGIFPASNEGVILALPLSEQSEVLARVTPGR